MVELALLPLVVLLLLSGCCVCRLAFARARALIPTNAVRRVLEVGERIGDNMLEVIAESRANGLCEDEELEGL